MFQLLNEYSGALSVIFSVMLVAATVAYAVLTWMLVHATKELVHVTKLTREMQLEPKITVFVVPEGPDINAVDLIVENVGPGPAYDIQFALEGDFVCIGNRRLSDVGFIKNGIRYLPPQGRRRTLFTILTDKGPGGIEKTSMSQTVKVAYSSVLGGRTEETLILDLAEFKNTIGQGRSSRDEFAPSIQAIAEDIHRLVQGYGRLHIVTDVKQGSEEGGEP